MQQSSGRWQPPVQRVAARNPGAPAVSAPKKRRRDPLWARLTVVLGALLMMASGGAIVGTRLLIGSYTNTIDQKNLLGDAAGAGGRAAIEGAINVLLVGVDQRPDNDETIRSDSIIILHIPASHDQAYLVSVPRDLLVEIPGHGRQKINAAFALGSGKERNREAGMQLLAQTLKKATGIKFDGGAIVDFGGFQKVVEALGGVDMCIDTRVASHHIGRDRNGNYKAVSDGGKPVVYEVGCRHLKPWEALDYVRQRYGLPNGDYDRQRHQQQFIKAIAKEAKAQGVATNPLKLRSIMQAAGPALTVDTNGVALEDWLFTLRGVSDNDMVMLKTNGGKPLGVQCGNESCEGLSPESIDMFAKIRDDKLADFIAQHPNFVSSDTIS